MILCVNLNAAIDKTVIVDDFSLNTIHRPKAVIALAGGKGANVARVINILGEHPIVTGFVGGYAGSFIEAGLHSEGIETSFVHTLAESRTCLSILDSTRQTLTEIYELGEPILPNAVRAFRKQFRTLLNRCEIVTLSGSLPQGVTADFYAELISLARKSRVPILLDTSGEPLIRGLRAGPTLVKPNRQEFGALIHSDVYDLPEFAIAAKNQARQSNTLMVISLGPNGVLAASPDQVWQAVPPQIQAQSPVGSGDAMLAGFAVGMIRKKNMMELLRLGVAAGTANALSVGAGRINKAEIRRVLKQVRVEALQ